MLLSKTSACSFVEEKLLVKNLEEKLTTDKLSVLEEIAFSWQDKIPFQVVSQLALEPEMRRMPSMEENIASVLSLHGGWCWTHNAAMHCVLTALGYDVMLILGSVFQPITNDHAITVLKNLTGPDSHHIIDVGVATVNPKVVSLDCDQESEVVDQIYMPYKYIKHQGWFVRCHKAEDDELESLPNVSVIDGWKLMYYFKLENTTYDAIGAVFEEKVYKNPDFILNCNLFMVIVPEGRFVFLMNNVLKVERSPGGQVDVITLETDDDVLNAILKYFHMLPEADVRRAVCNWRKIMNTK